MNSQKHEWWNQRCKEPRIEAVRPKLNGVYLTRANFMARLKNSPLPTGSQPAKLEATCIQWWIGRQEGTEEYIMRSTPDSCTSHAPKDSADIRILRLFRTRLTRLRAVSPSPCHLQTAWRLSFARAADESCPSPARFKRPRQVRGVWREKGTLNRGKYCTIEREAHHTKAKWHQFKSRDRTKLGQGTESPTHRAKRRPTDAMLE